MNLKIACVIPILLANCYCLPTYRPEETKLGNFWEKMTPHLGKPFETKSADTDAVQVRSFTTNKKFLWPNARVPYEIDQDYDQYEHKKIAKAIKLFHTVTCIRFVPRTTERDYVRFAKSPDTCASVLGHRGGKQEIHLKDSCFYLGGYRGAVVHEMMHALGFIHEQQRADRDCYLKITGVGKTLSDLVYILPTDIKFPYDFHSIMHYKEREYMKGRHAERLGNRAGTLDTMDVQKLNYLYCGKPHYCELHPAECQDAALADKLCIVNLPH